jgi:hypothetical protein
MNTGEELLAALNKRSKHSQYQRLPDSLTGLLGGGKIEAKGRYEKERLEYILKKTQIAGRSVIDVGGNTGYFTFEAVKAGALKVHYYEGNREHAGFVRQAASALHMAEKIKVSNEYVLFEPGPTEGCGVMFLLNVLHHLGDDFGDGCISMGKAKLSIVEKLNALKESAAVLVFQLGFNWKGKTGQCLFDNGTKKEMIEYVKSGTKESWDITDIGIAVKKEGVVVYEDLSVFNEARDDSLGEFLNRPIFIMRSKGAAK